MLYSIYSVSQVWEENLGFWRQENTEADSEGSELMQLILFLKTEELHVTFEMFRPACVTNGCKLELQQSIIMGDTVQEYASVLHSPLACCWSILSTTLPSGFYSSGNTWAGLTGVG